MLGMKKQRFGCPYTTNKQHLLHCSSHIKNKKKINSSNIRVNSHYTNKETK
jgi:hypothetical protein